MSQRDWQSPEYKKWRKAVGRRDGWKCRLCGSKQNLEIHHIRKWSTHKHLRRKVDNGVALCSQCHLRVTGNEELYEGLMKAIQGGLKSSVSDVQVLMERYRDGEEGGGE